MTFDAESSRMKGIQIQMFHSRTACTCQLPGNSQSARPTCGSIFHSGLSHSLAGWLLLNDSDSPSRLCRRLLEKKNTNVTNPFRPLSGVLWCRPSSSLQAPGTRRAPDPPTDGPPMHTRSLWCGMRAYHNSDRSFIAPPCLFACHPLQTLRIFNIKIMITGGGGVCAHPPARSLSNNAAFVRLHPFVIAMGLEFFIIFANTPFVLLVHIYLWVLGRHFSPYPRVWQRHRILFKVYIVWVRAPIIKL